jgi:hypothetical protein
MSPENIATRVSNAAVDVANSASPYPSGERARVRYGTVSSANAFATAADNPYNAESLAIRTASRERDIRQ